MITKQGNQWFIVDNHDGGPPIFSQGISLNVHYFDKNTYKEQGLTTFYGNECAVLTL